MYHFVTCW